MRVLGMRSQVQPLSFSLPFLSFSITRVGLGLPAVGGDQVAVVLHGLAPVVHQVLIDIVGVDERLTGVVREQALGQRCDDLLGMAAGLQSFKRLGARLPPRGEMSVHAGDEGGELGVPVDGGLDGRLLYRGNRRSQGGRA